MTAAAAAETRPSHRMARVTVAPAVVLTSLSRKIRDIVHRDDARMLRQIEALGPKLLFAEVHVIGRHVVGIGQPDRRHRW